MARKNDKNERIESHPNVKGRILPHNDEAEQSVLGCALVDENATVYICSELKEDDFYTLAHRDIFAAILAVYYENKPVDIVTLVQRLEAMGVMESVGGISYVSSLTDIVPTLANYTHYTKIVKKNSTLRKLISASQRIADIAYSGDMENDVLTFAESEIFSISAQQDKSHLTHISSSADAAIKQMEELFLDPKAFRGVPTGFTRLNNMLNGFQKGDLVVIGARPSQGKTSIGMNFILSAALNKERRDKSGQILPYHTAVFSVEMPSVSIAKRLLCTVAKVDMSKASSGSLTKEEFKRIMEARRILSETHIHIDDSGASTPIDILSKCRRLKREQGLDIIMIDYLGLMKSGMKTENKQQDIAEITRLLKIAAKELEVPILLLCQLSRELEKRTDKRPQMSDLRESGAIEQDADVIIFIYREHDARDNSIEETLRNKVELIVAKHRNGDTGPVEVRWIPQYVSFVDPPNQTLQQEQSAPPNSGSRASFQFSDPDMQPESIASVREEFSKIPANSHLINDATRNEITSTVNVGNISTVNTGNTSTVDVGNDSTIRQGNEAVISTKSSSLTAVVENGSLSGGESLSENEAGRLTKGTGKDEVAATMYEDSYDADSFQDLPPPPPLEEAAGIFYDSLPLEQDAGGGHDASSSTTGGGHDASSSTTGGGHDSPLPTAGGDAENIFSKKKAEEILKADIPDDLLD